MTEIHANNLDKKTMLRINNQDISNANMFSDVTVGQAFWYENSNGLVEIAINQGSACEILNIKIGTGINK
jgi:S-adenosyl-L-methionine hydrolase (adenosine-forming)